MNVVILLLARHQEQNHCNNFVSIDSLLRIIMKICTGFSPIVFKQAKN